MYVDTGVGGNKLQKTVDTGAEKVYMVEELANKISLPYNKEKGYVKGVNPKSLPMHGVARGTNIQVERRKGKVDITVAPLDDRKFYLGMDFVNKVKPIIVPHAGTLFIVNNGQPHAIPIRREFEKEKVLTALRFPESKEVGHLSALKSDQGPVSVIPPTSPGKLAQRRKCARMRMGRKRVKGRSAEQTATTHHPN